MFYKDSDCSYQSKYSCLPPITVNVTCESTGGNGDENNCCCSKVSMRDVLNYLITPQIASLIDNVTITGIKQLSNNADIISVSNDLVRVDGSPDADISICAIYEMLVVANNTTAANALEAAVRANPLYSGTITVLDDPCCCKKEIIDRLIAARAANTPLTIDTESVNSSNPSGRVIGIAPDIVWIRRTAPDTNFHIISICRIGAFRI